MPPTDMRWGVWSGDTCDGCHSGPRGGDALVDLLLWSRCISGTYASWEYVDVRTTYPMGRVPAIL
jgi:hypothetical protein